MEHAFDPILSIPAALNRKALADARHRTALARRLGVTQNEMLAVQHLARAGGRGEGVSSQPSCSSPQPAPRPSLIASREPDTSPAKRIHSTAAAPFCGLQRPWNSRPPRHTPRSLPGSTA
jgi:hypothetical protein